MTDNIIMLRWYDHYNDPHLEEDYDVMQRVFKKHPEIRGLFDCDEVGVFSYPNDAHADLIELEDSLLKPQYWSSWEEFASDHDSDPNDPMAVFGQVQYDAQLYDISKQAGTDEREFDRLWTQKFVLGEDDFDEMELIY